MPQMSSAPRPASRSPKDGRNINLPPVQPRDDSLQSGGQTRGRGMPQEPQGESTMHVAQHEQQQFVQGQQRRTVGEEQRTPGSSRSLGVHNILNPSEPESSERSTPGYGGPVAPSPQSVGSTSQYLTNPSTFPSQGYTGQQNVSSSPPSENLGRTSSRPRKLAIPRSPRTVSLGGRTPATIDAQQAPFLSRGRMYTAEPGAGPFSEVPPMPQQAGPPQHLYNIQPGTAGPLGRRKSMPRLSAASQTPISQSTSPSPSIKSPYTGPSPLSPRPRHQLGSQPQTVSYFPGSSFGAPQQGSEASQAGPPGTEGPYMTSLPESIFRHGAQSGGQNSNIRFMPISTEHGPMYVPVDVQAASKMADEKRARNAGASARFRERRKQKEKEASMNIQKLEQQLRDLEKRARDAETDRDFYRGERDRFRDVCFRNPSTRDLALQAPMSPRLSRTTAFQPPQANPMYQASEGGPPQDDEPPRMRRRTGEYKFAPAAAPPPTLSSYQGTIYGPGSGTGAPPPSTALPPIRMSNIPPPPSMGGASAPPNMPAATTRPPPFEQYPRPGYDRSWSGEGGGQRQ